MGGPGPHGHLCDPGGQHPHGGERGRYGGGTRRRHRRGLTPETPGRIVFAGTGAGVQRITADLPFLVTDHAAVEGDTPAPEPSAWEQYVTRMQQALDAVVPPTGNPGQVLTKTLGGQRLDLPLGGRRQRRGGYTIGAGLRLDPESNVLSVDTADAVEADNTRPVTSAAVYTTVGNIDALLATI